MVGKIGASGHNRNKTNNIQEPSGKVRWPQVGIFQILLGFLIWKMSSPPHRKLIVYGLVLYVLVALKTNAKVPRIRTTISKVVVSRARQHAESHQVARIRTTSGGQKGTFGRGSQCRTKTCLKIGSNNISIRRFLNTQVVISRGKVEVFRAGSNTIDL